MKREYVILPGFEQQWQSYRLSDEDLREVEWFLCKYPDFYFITVYPKNEKDDLSQEEKKIIRKLVSDLETELRRE